MSSPRVEQVTENYLNLGEGPHWDEEKQVLYYVGIHDQLILKYDPAKDRVTSAKLDGKVGFVVPLEGRKNQFVAGVGLSFVVIEWDGESDQTKLIETLSTVEQEPKFEGSRLNDGKADPNGKLFAGTMGKEYPLGNFMKHNSALYRLEKNGARVVDSPISLSNGLAWDLKKNLMYYIDSVDQSVFAYDYDQATGDAANKRVIINFEKSGIQALPDGMTIDRDGNLWIACFNGHQVVKVDPTEGKVLQKVEIPAAQVTSVAFGGRNLDELYVTTASMDIPGPRALSAGALFKITGLGVKGFASTACRL